MQIDEIIDGDWVQQQFDARQQTSLDRVGGIIWRGAEFTPKT